MNQDYVMALVRTLMQMVGSSVTAAGYATGDQWTTITGGVVALAGVLWMLIARWNTKVVSDKSTGGAAYAHSWLALPLIAAMFLGGCATLNPQVAGMSTQMALAIAKQIAPGAVAKLDKSIAQLADGRLDKACDIFGVAVGYYTTLRPAIAPTLTKVGDPASAAGGAICAAPPSDTASALAALNRAWAAVQDSTKAP